MNVLYEGWLARVSLDETKTAVWLERKEQAAKTPREAGMELDRMNDALLGLPTAKMTLIVDARHSRGRNDPEFEAQILPVFHAFTQRFKKVGVLVGTVTGELQLTRLVKEKGLGYLVFRDEAKAREFAGIVA